MQWCWVGGFVVQPPLHSTPPPSSRCARFPDAFKRSTKVRCTCIYPGVIETELASTISDDTARDAMNKNRAMAIKPDAIGRAMRFALEQPNEVNVNEIVVRPPATYAVRLPPRARV